MALRPQLTHMGFYSSKLDELERFYVETVGLVVTDRGRVPRLNNTRIVFLSASKESHHQVVLIEGEVHGPSRIDQISFKVGSLAELRAVHDKLRAADAPVRPVSHGNAWSVYSKDPEGNGLEFYLDSPWQVAQPRGEPLDLSLSDEEIHRRTESALRAEPTMQPRETWAEAFARRLSE